MKKLLSVFLAFLVAGIPMPAQSTAVTISVDASAGRRPINPMIYGVNLASTQALNDLNVPLNRFGGNHTTRYNWKHNATNRAMDWYFESLSEEGNNPGEAGDRFIIDTKNGGAEPMLTLPKLGWVAKLGPNRQRLASFSIQKYGEQTGRDWAWFPDAGNGIRVGGARIQDNDPNDANMPADSLYQQDWVRQIVGKWGTANRGGLRYYILDNEHTIWFETHRDVSRTGAHATEIRDKMIEYSARVKAIDPAAQVVGPEEWGWDGFRLSGFDHQYGARYGWGYLPDRDGVMGGMLYYPWLLSQWKAAGVKPVDVLSFHYYPQEGEYSDDTSTARQLIRNRSTRALWDPNYKDTSWIQGYVKLIPRMRQWADGYYYPGTPLALTKYSWGADKHINGATAQADVLGIFGREGLDMANRWTTPEASTPTYKAIQMYRNYDGRRSTFGDTSVRVTVPNPDQVSAFAAVRSSDNALTVMVINKQLTSSAQLNLSLATFAGAGKAEAYQTTAANAITRLADLPVTGQALSTAVPAQSITLFVLPASDPGQGGNQSPVASISATPETGYAPAAITFSGAASKDPDGSIASYAWEFGDGTTAMGVTVRKTYTADGAYVAKLTVTDDRGASATQHKMIAVNPAPTGAGCAVQYKLVNDWGSGFLGEVTVFNRGAAEYPVWTLQFNFSGDQNITSFWNSVITQSGQAVTAKDAGWNAKIPVNGSASFGFVANRTSANTVPSTFTVNGSTCSIVQ